MGCVGADDPGRRRGRPGALPGRPGPSLASGQADRRAAPTRRSLLMNVPSLTRSTVAVSLVLGGVLTAVSVVTMPDFSGDNVSSLEAIADSPVATLSSLTWIASQLFL